MNTDLRIFKKNLDVNVLISIFFKTNALVFEGEGVFNKRQNQRCKIILTISPIN